MSFRSHGLHPIPGTSVTLSARTDFGGGGRRTRRYGQPAISSFVRFAALNAVALAHNGAMPLMRSPRLAALAAVLLCTSLFTLGLAGRGPADSVDLPARLSDQEFWKLTVDLSEPDGTFRSDNLLSNEMVFARLVPDFVAKVKQGGVYLGVGPEQNFTYLVAMKSRLAFITDIRRENLHLHLMYKALFEMSADRAEFIARLFNKPRPAGLSKSSSIVDLMAAYGTVPTADEVAYTTNLQAIQGHLTKAHAFPMTQVDLDGVARVYRAFHYYGLAMDYSTNLDLTSSGGRNAATYADLMTQTGANGAPLTYLGTEDTFAFIKDMESKNLIVPVVGNFGGPKAIRAIGDYVRSRGATVAAFYVSSVEPYLKRAGTFEAFCASVATLPMDDSSVFIRPGNLPNLLATGAPIVSPPPDMPQIGQYQLGVIMPMNTGCV